jgi:hypothetical protein
MGKNMWGIRTKLAVSALVLSMVLCTVTLPALADPAPSASVSPASQTVDPGNTFSIDIFVNTDNKGVSAGQFFFAFDANVMQVDSVTAGNLFGASPNAVGPFIDNVNGTLELALARKGLTTPPTPNGTFATIMFTVNVDASEGTYALDITNLLLSDENFASIAGIVTNDGNVTVTSEDGTPPTYSNIVVSPASPAIYDPDQNYTFNITVQDNVAIDTVLLEFDSVNYTAYAYSNSVFSYQFTGLAVGQHTYRWYMNDISDNWNSTPSQSYIVTYPRWDINADGIVNFVDLTILSAHWLETTTPPYPAYDINEDGTVNFVDLTILSAHWLEVY